MLRTERLTLRQIRLEDATGIRRLILDKQASEYAAYDHPVATDEEAVLGLVAYCAASDAFWVAEENETRELIGWFSLNPCEEPDVRNLGFLVHSSGRGQGYALEACRRLIDYAFGELELKKLVTGTALVNVPSVRLLEKLGFTKVRELEASFAKDEKGNPITFLGGEYELSRDI